MPDNDIQYTVELGDGRKTRLNQEQYDKYKDKIYADPSTKVVSTQAFTPTEDFTPSSGDVFRVDMPDGRYTTLDSAQYMQYKDKILQSKGANITRMHSTSNDYWLKKWQEDEDRIGAIDEELKGLPEGQKMTGLNAANVEAAKQAGDTLARRKALTDESDAIKAARDNNPVYQRYWEWQRQNNAEEQQRLIEAQAKLNEDNPEAAKAYQAAMYGGLTPFGTAGLASKTDKEYNIQQESLGRARLLLDETRKIIEAPTKYSENRGVLKDFWKGVVDGAPDAISQVNLLKAGLDMHLVDAIKKIQDERGADVNISDYVKSGAVDRADNLGVGEKELVKAFVKKAEVENLRNGDITRSYQAGKGAVASLGFMADFALMGGVGDVAATKIAGEAVQAAGRKTAQKLVAETAYGAVKAAAMTPLMPSTYVNVMNNMMQLDDAGQIDLSAKAVVKASADALIENISETIGAKPLEFAALPLGKIKYPDWVKAMKNSPIMGTLKQAGYNGFFEEMFEEVTGNALRAVTGVDKDALKNFLTWDQLLITAGSFAPMALFGLGTSAVQFGMASKGLNDANARMETMINELGENVDKKPMLDALKDMRSAETPEELASQMTTLCKQMVEAGADEKALLKTAMNVTNATARYNIVNGQYEEGRDAERARMMQEIDTRMANGAEVNQTDWYHTRENGMNSVRTLTDQDGNIQFVVAQGGGEMVTVGMDGQRHMMPEAEFDQRVADGVLTDSGEQDLYQWLDNQSEGLKRQMESTRMAAEYQRNRNAVLNTLNELRDNGWGFNMGTTESPRTGYVSYIDGDNVVISTRDENGAITSETITLKQFADKMGMPLEAMTDQQAEQEEIALQEALSDQRRKYNTIPTGTDITIDMSDVGGEDQQVKFVKAIHQPGEQFVRIYVADQDGNPITNAEGEQQWYPSTMVRDIDAMADSAAANTSAATSEETPEQEPVEQAPAVQKYTQEDGSVDERAFYEAEPEEWAKWNDEQRGDNGEGTQRVMRAGIQKLDKEIAKAQAALDAEADPVVAKEKENALQQIIGRRDKLAATLGSYQQRAANVPEAAAAEEEAEEETTPENIYAEVYGNEAFETAEEADAFVEGKIASAQQEVDQAQANLEQVQANNKAGAYTTPSEFAQAKAAAVQAVDSARQTLDRWTAVRETARKEQQRAANVEARRQDELSTPQTLNELVADMFVGLRNSLNKESFKKETGYSDKDLRPFFQLFAKKGQGMGVERLAEYISENVQPEQAHLIPTDANGQKDVSAVRDAILDVFQSVSKPSDLYNYVRNSNLNREAEEQRRMEEEARQAEEQAAAEKATFEEQPSEEKATTEAQTKEEANAIYEQAVDDAIKVEEDWETRIGDYVAEHYPTQAVISAETRSEKGRAEAQAMRHDPVIWDLRQKAREAVNEANRKVDEALAQLNKFEAAEQQAKKATFEGQPSEEKATFEEQPSAERATIEDQPAAVEVQPAHPATLRQAYESGSAEAIAQSEKAMSDFIGSSSDIDAVNTTMREATERRKKAQKGSAEYRTQDFIAKATRTRLKELHEAGLKTFEERSQAAQRAYLDMEQASVQELTDALAFYDSQDFESARYRSAEIREELARRNALAEEDMPEEIFNDGLTDDQVNALSFAMGKTPAQVRAEARAGAIQNYIDSIASESDGATVATSANMPEVMRAFGCSETSIEKVVDALNSGQRIRGFRTRNHIFMVSDHITTVDDARSTYVHERQHGITASAQYAPIVLGMFNNDRAVLLDLTARMSGADYSDFNNAALADEVLSMAMEAAYTVSSEELEGTLREAGINNEEFINFVKTIDDEQRHSGTLSNARRRPALDNRGQEGSIRQNGRDSQKVSGGNLDISGSRSTEDGQRGTGEGQDNLFSRAGREDRVAEDGLDTQEGSVLFSKNDGSLVGLHNITEGQIIKSLKTGGLANPSMAVIDFDRQNHEQYGEISLVAPASLVDSRSGRNAGTFTGDVWSPTYPRVTKHMSSKGSDVFYKDIMALPEDVRNKVENAFDNYLEDDRESNALKWWFLEDTGRKPEIAHYQSQLTPEEKEQIDIINETRGEDTFRMAEALFRKYADAEAIERAETKIVPKKPAEETTDPGRLRIRRIVEEINSDIDKYGISTSSVWRFFDQLQMQAERDGKLDEYTTFDNAQKAVEDGKLDKEFNTWLRKKEDTYGVEEKLFSHWTRDGYKRYVPNTVENASRLMNKEQVRNGEGGRSVSATKAMLMSKLTSLEQIRQNKDRLTTFEGNDYEIPEYKAASDNWVAVVDQLSDKKKIDDNPFINMDYAAARLHEALLEKNPIAYLNREYGYSLTEDGDFAKALSASIKEIKALPTKYFETVFRRPVYLNEFAAAVVPTDASQEVKDALSNAGLPLFEYDDKVEGSRRAATEEATDIDGVRFSKVASNQDAEYMKAVEEGDMEKAQQMVRDAFKVAFPNTVAVDEQGNPMLLYHGTHSPYFTEFARPGENLQGLIWVTDDKRYAEYYNDHGAYDYENEPEGFEGLYKLYADVENPLEIGYIEDLVGSENWNKIAASFGMTPQELGERLKATYKADVKLTDYIYDYTRGEEFVKLLKENNYDGVLALEDGANKIPTIGLISPNQVKSADPVTYDDKGNVIPLSERFNSESDDIRFSKANATNKQPGKEYPIDIDDAEVMFSLSKNNRKTIETWLGKRKDITDEQRKAVVDYLETLENPKLQLATARWFARGVVRLPEDMSKIEQAVSVAGKAKVDPLQYDSPMALLDAHADFEPSEKRINPDEVSTLHKAQEYPEYGLSVYDVEDSEESRQNMRQIINTHFGKEASPWCLLQGDGNGNLTEDSGFYWNEYNGYPKQVAFKDGKLLAFSANDTEDRLWWDRQDRPWGGIPVTKKIEGDELGRSATYKVKEDGSISEPEDAFRGNKQNGTYEEWHNNGNQKIKESYKDGQPDGEQLSWYDNGQLEGRRYYKEGMPIGRREKYYRSSDGEVHPYAIDNYDENGKLDGPQQEFYSDGSIKFEVNYSHGSIEGHTTVYNNKGIMTSRTEYRNDVLNGEKTLWYDNGQVREVSHWKDDKKNGLVEEYSPDGTLTRRVEYKDDKRDGLSQGFYDNGQMSMERHYKDGKLNGAWREWYPDGQLESELNFKNDHEDGSQRRWSKEGVLVSEMNYNDGYHDGPYMLFYGEGTPQNHLNYKMGKLHGVQKYWAGLSLARMEEWRDGKFVRDLLKEGVTEEEADNIRFSKVTDAERLAKLESEPTIKAYRAMVMIDGKLYPPMSTKEPNAKGERGKKLKLREPSELGAWEQADEAPAKAYEGKDGKYYFDLKKDNGSDVNGVLYNPYIHTSMSPLNDQFSGASERPNLVTVEVEVPMSEPGSGYKAEKAADAVGFKDWHSGTVTAQLGEGRQVLLTRFAKPVRVVPDSEVAEIVAPKLKAKNVSVPYKVVTPSLREELAKRGVNIIGEDDVLFSKNDVSLSDGQTSTESQGNASLSDEAQGGAADRVQLGGNESDGKRSSFDYWAKRYNIRKAADGKQTLSFADLQRLFRDLRPDARTAAIFDRVVALAERAEANTAADNIQFYFERPDNPNEAGATSFAGEIRFNPANLTDPSYRQDKAADTIAHELVHRFTMSTVEAYRKGGKAADALTEEQKAAAKELIDIYKEAKQRFKHLESSDSSRYKTAYDEYNYRFKNPHEFLAGIANTDFRTMLIGIDNGTKNLWERIKDAFKRMLGIDATAGSVYEELSNTLDNLLDNYSIDTFEAMKDTEEILPDVLFSKTNENNEIFVSNAQMAVRAIPMGKATPEQWLKMIEGKGGMKAGEDKWLGLSDWLKASDKKTITKEEIEDYIDENRIQIEEDHYASDSAAAEAAMQPYVEEFNELVAHPEAAYDAADDRVAEFYEEMRAKYGDDYLDKLNESEFAIEGNLLNWREEAANKDPYESAFDQMVEKYGDDFSQAFYLNGERLDYDGDMEGNPSDAARWFLDIDDKPIDSTRLAYTTEGLTNKREIALTVPTIEPWNESDQIHFGDAGEGRAVAWARFGDAQEDNKKVLFIDEIQSKRHQEGREHGYYDSRLDDADSPDLWAMMQKYGVSVPANLRSEILKKVDDASDTAHRLSNEFSQTYPKWTTKEEYEINGFQNVRLIADASVVGQDKADEYNNAMKASREGIDDVNELDRMERQARWRNSKVPAAPFEKNWHELAMKRMLRYAAENGYDVVAWTTGDQQAERYDIGQVVKSIGYDEPAINSGVEKSLSRHFVIGKTDGDKIHGRVFTDGEYKGIIQETWENSWGGKPLSDVLGKALAEQIVNAEGGGSIEGEGLRIGAEGMKGFYDDILPRFMNKYGKKWGVSTRNAFLTLNDGAHLEAHAVDVNDAMKESVMEGQVMFSKSARAVEEVREKGIGAVVGEDGVSEFYDKMYGSMAESMRRELAGDIVGNGLNTRKAIADRLSEIAYNGYENDDTGALLMAEQMLAYYNGEALNPDAVRYILWRGEKGVDENNTLDVARDMAMRRRLKTGVYEEEPLRFSLRDEVEEANTEASEAADEAKSEKDTTTKELKKDELLTAMKAMMTQKAYDQKTVAALTDLAKRLVKEQGINEMTRREIARIMGIIKASVGRTPKVIKRYADTIIDIALDNMLRTERNILSDLTSVKGNRVNATGVEVRGALDVRAQNILKIFRKNTQRIPYVKDADGERTVDTNALDKDINEAYEEMQSADEAVRNEAEVKYEALLLAKEYFSTIQTYMEEESGLEEAIADAKKEYREGTLPKNDYDAVVAETGTAMRENHISQVEAMRAFNNKMRQVVAEGRLAATEEREAEKERVGRIHHLANSDMEGVPTDDPGKRNNRLNSGLMQFVTGPLGTFTQFLRLFGRKNVYGEGNLFSWAMPAWRKAHDAEYIGRVQAMEALDAKAAEILGKGKKFSDLTAIERAVDRKMASKGETVKLTFRHSGAMKEYELGQDQLLYIYMVNKMTDGKMKLRRMGISEEMVDAIKGQIDERLIRFADWVQDEYLTDLRNKYNATHERVFGASMGAIEHYFPLRIDQRDITKTDDISEDLDGALPSTVTGSIIKRKRNTKAIDIVNAGALGVLMEHVREMEHWNAYAEFIRDMNTLLSYTRFRNTVTSMRTVYGTGDVLWKNWRDTVKIAVGAYRPKISKSDRFITNMARAVSTAKVNFRIGTAIKQLASMTAFIPDMGVDKWLKSITNPMGTWKWAMKNIPSFNERWGMLNAGDEKLMPSDADYKMWNTDIMQWLTKVGLTPNKAVDAMTVAIGARSVYETRKSRYLSEGFEEEEAEKKAIQDATTAFNETQQSSEGAFLSAMQKDRDFISTSFTVFRNGPFGYGRKVVNSMRNLGRMIKNPQFMKDGMKKQLMREGLEEEQAEKVANRRFNKAWSYHCITIATNAFINALAWNVFGHLFYYLFGDDDKKKKQLLTEDALQTLGGPVEGLAAGNHISSVIGNLANGKRAFEFSPQLNPMMSDLQSTFQHAQNDPVRAYNDLINIAAQAFTGVNPQTFTDAVAAVVDACDNDIETSKEALLLTLRIMQVPQSQLDEIYIDELGVTAKGARAMEVNQLAKRYARYKMMRETPFTNGMYDDEQRAKKLKSKEKTFRKKVNDRIKLHKQIDND